MICMPAVVCTEQPYILLRDHCHKCIAFEERKIKKKKTGKNPIEIGFEDKEKVEQSIKAIEMRTYLQMSGPGT